MSSLWTISYSELTLRLILAGVLGGLVGWEREKNNHAAGFRTHILVSLGSALIMLISIYGFSDFVNEENVRIDPARIAAQVVSGIGFLGAGTILRHGANVTGLTTAASLWVVAGVGLAVGTGFIFGAILTTFLVLISLELLNRLEKIIMNKQSFRILHIYVLNEPGKLVEMASFIEKYGGKIRKVNINEKGEEDNFMNIEFTVRLPEEIDMTLICEEVRKIKGVKRVYTE